MHPGPPHPGKSICGNPQIDSNRRIRRIGTQWSHELSKLCTLAPPLLLYCPFHCWSLHAQSPPLCFEQSVQLAVVGSLLSGSQHVDHTADHVKMSCHDHAIVIDRLVYQQKLSDRASVQYTSAYGGACANCSLADCIVFKLVISSAFPAHHAKVASLESPTRA